MPNQSPDTVFLLIRSLKKSEKRNFKTFVTRNTATQDLNVVKLFDALDKMSEYNETVLLKKLPSLKKQQLSNAKAHLYRLILQSLRLISDEENIDIQLHEQLGFARILFNKGLYHQALRILDKLKQTAAAGFQYSYWQQALFFEKKIEALYITRSMETRARELAEESVQVTEVLARISELSNLALQLYSRYIRYGHARNEEDVQQVNAYFQDLMAGQRMNNSSFYEQMYFYQCHNWKAFICQDFLMYYRYSRKWVELFEAHPAMKQVEPAYYAKGLHNLVSAHFILRTHDQLRHYTAELEKLSLEPAILRNESSQIQVLVYLFAARINIHFAEGRFTDGLSLVPEIEAALKNFQPFLDNHRVLVFYYKIACLYFGSGDNAKTIMYLNQVINYKTDLRTDIQCYARLLHLIAHYEMGNDEVLEYLFKSVYRFMAGMKNLSLVEEEILAFLHRSFKLTRRDLQLEFIRLLDRLKMQENNRFETRALLYLDVISWLESKVKGVPVQEIMRGKYLGGGG